MSRMPHPLSVIACLLMLGAIFKAVDLWASLPIVEVSYSSRDCVRVIEFTYEKEGYSCEDLPAKYEHVWVR